MSDEELEDVIEDSALHTYPLCKKSDIPEGDMKSEVLEICTTATEKYMDNHQQAAQMIKESLDKNFGPPFHVIVGESYGFSIIYQEQTLLYMFINGNTAVLVWRTEI